VANPCRGEGGDRPPPQTAQCQALASSFRTPVIAKSTVISFAYQKAITVVGLTGILINAYARATYTRKTIQHKPIECRGNLILSKILQSVNNSCYYGILFDETTDTRRS